MASHFTLRINVFQREFLHELKISNFVEHCLQIFVEFCDRKDVIKYLEPNVPLSLLERGSELELRAQKSECLTLSPCMAPFANAPPTPALVSAAANVLHNVSAFKNCPIQTWNDQGLYRVLFRCTYWCGGSAEERGEVRAATSRALAAACAHKCVRASLAATKDCLYNLLKTFTPFDESECGAGSACARTQSLLLLASLLPERAAADCVWAELKNSLAHPFFHSLLQCMRSDDDELQEAALHCMSQLTQSTARMRHADKSKDTSCAEFLDNLKSPLYEDGGVTCGAGDGGGGDCRPEYLVEEICTVLIDHFNKLSENNKHSSSQDERWVSVCACLGGALAGSGRARRHAAPRLPAALLASLRAARDRLSLHGQPADVIRNANHEPTLNTLYWLLTVMSCLMLDCAAAKEALADGGLAPSLVRLWPWTMATEQLRHAVLHLLVTYTNRCPKAWASMCQCVGGRCLAGEVCAALVREAARARPTPLLAMCMRVLRQCAPHHHCRAIILKSDAVSASCRVRGGEAGGAGGAEGARLCAALARYADGAGALLAACPRPAPARLLPALANAAHHARTAFLHSTDLLELVSGALLTGDVGEAVHAARAAWALAANNHRAKLVLRSAGVTAAVRACAERLQRRGGRGAERALQLLAYTHRVLLAT